MELIERQNSTAIVNQNEKMQKDSSNVDVSMGFDSSILQERLVSMKKSRSGLLANVTRLPGELEVLFLDIANYEEASRKKVALDEAFGKCLEFCKKYSCEVPSGELYTAEKQEAEATCTDLCRRRTTCDQNYEQFVQLCTDKEPSASDLCNSASKRSSVSSIARKQEMIALQVKQMELELGKRQTEL